MQSPVLTALIDNCKISLLVLVSLAFMLPRMSLSTGGRTEFAFYICIYIVARPRKSEQRRKDVNLTTAERIRRQGQEKNTRN